jgi:hypothetical protein
MSEGQIQYQSSLPNIDEEATEAKRQFEMVDASAAIGALDDAKANALASEIRSGKRVFISPRARNFRKLIQPGRPTVVYAGTKIAAIAGQPAAGGTEIARIGDIFAHFVGGVMVVDPTTDNGKVILAWAEKNPDLCRDAMDPTSEVWAALKTAQLNLAHKEPSMAQNLDVDRMLSGDYSGFTERDSLVAKARKVLTLQGVTV